MKTHIHKIIITLMATAMISFGASCSKEEQPRAQSSVAKPVPAAVPAAVKKSARPLLSAMPNATPIDVFSLTRHGEKVTVTIKADPSPCHSVVILRCHTGLPRDRVAVGQVAGAAEQFVDTLPDNRPCWYWLSIRYANTRGRSFGPLRIGPDEGNSGRYAVEKTAGRFPWKVTRTDTTATITWDFPEEVSSVHIKRGTSKASNRRGSVHMTRERKGAFTDTFPDPQANYWYRMEVRLESGAVVPLDPVRAEFSEKQ